MREAIWDFQSPEIEPPLEQRREWLHNGKKWEGKVSEAYSATARFSRYDHGCFCAM